MIKTDFLCKTCGCNLVQIGPTEWECPECDWYEPTEKESAAIARAEAAEAELASALAVIDLYQSRMFAAEKRAAELEAAQAWRPVTEPPGEDVELELLVAGAYRRGDGEFVDEFFGRPVRPTHYRVPRPTPKEGDDGDL